MIHDQPSLDEPALATWTAFKSSLLSFFQRRVPAADADDLLQESYLRISQGLHRLKDNQRIAGWVFRMAHNLVIDFRRKQSRPIEARSDRDVERLEAGPHVDTELDAVIAEWLTTAIDRLPPKYSSVLRESELLERPHREIAHRLGVSVSAIKSRVQRGRALLRGELEACCRLEFDRRGAIDACEPRVTDATDCGEC